MYKKDEIIIFRCDSSNEIGTGHIFRCLNLARELSLNGYEIIFFCRKHFGNINKKIEKEFKLVELESPNIEAGKNNIDKSEGYKNWMKCTQEDDAKECFEKIISRNIKKLIWVVVDHYGINDKWITVLNSFLEKAKINTPKFLAVDDLFRSNLGTEILINPNLPEELSKPRYMMNQKNLKFLFGPQYALLEKNYEHLQQKVKIRKNIKKILIFFGGVDLEDHTSITLEILQNTDLKDIFIDVVLGKNYTNKSKILENYSSINNIKIHYNIPSLSKLILNADLAIGAAGTHSWERVALGLPSIIIPIANNQIDLANYLAEIKVSKLVKNGKFIRENICKELKFLIQNNSELTKMSERALQITDCKGALRIASYINKKNHKNILRLANKKDIYTLFRWKNDKIVRENSFNKKYISFEEHKKWFENKLISNNALLFIFENEKKLPIAQVRFEQIIPNQFCARISFSIDELFRGKGLASQVLNIGINNLQKHWPNIHKVYGEVSKKNIKSSRSFIKAGFREQKTSVQDIITYYKKI